MNKLFNLWLVLCAFVCGSSYSQEVKSHYFNNDFRAVSKYEVDNYRIVLEKKIYKGDYRRNPDGSKFYRTAFAIRFDQGGKSERTTFDTDVYTTDNYDTGMLPCMLIDLEKQVLFIFSNSKGSDQFYGMDGFVYRIDLNTKQWTKETVFTGRNYGWFSFFGGSNNGNPELWHFSFAGYYSMCSTRSSNGNWNNNMIAKIKPESAAREYPSHQNILVTSNAGVARMGAGASSSSSSSNSSFSSDDLSTGAVVIGAGALLYGLYKALTDNSDSSSSSSPNNNDPGNVLSYRNVEIVEAELFSFRAIHGDNTILHLRNKNNYDVIVRIEMKIKGTWKPCHITYEDGITETIDGTYSDDTSTAIHLRRNAMRTVVVTAYSMKQPDGLRIVSVQ